MTEEEKEKYEELKSLLYTGTISQYGKRKLIDIFDKQQKEIENLLQDYKQDEKIIQKMAEYIRNIKTDYEQDYCNIENCNYHKTNCSNKCIIDYFRKRCKQ